MDPYANKPESSVGSGLRKASEDSKIAKNI